MLVCGIHLGVKNIELTMQSISHLLSAYKMLIIQQPSFIFWH